jgi:putative solute:sodium symporter small subunit
MDANLPSIGNAKFGFWMAQQGSIICFVLLLVLYAFLMNKLDHKHGYDVEEASSSEPEPKAEETES